MNRALHVSTKISSIENLNKAIKPSDITSLAKGLTGLNATSFLNKLCCTWGISDQFCVPRPN